MCTIYVTDSSTTYLDQYLLVTCHAGQTCNRICNRQVAINAEYGMKQILIIFSIQVVSA